MDGVEITAGVTIPMREIRFRFARSGGPGGQNVNKVESRVELLFDVATSTAFTETQRQRLRSALRNKLDDDGMLQIVVQESRSQWQNRELALARLAETIRVALIPRKKRVATRPSRGAKEERFRSKKKRGEVKRNRGRVTD